MLSKPIGLSLLVIALLLLGACAPTTTTAVVAVPSPAGAAPAAVASTGPQMQVGSPWPYVDGTLLVPVPAGPFTMGNDGPDSPVHTVTLSDFWIYATKVTNQQFAACVAGGGCTAPDPGDNPGYPDATNADRPVVGVTYDQATAYCTYVHARLPTEAEWEKTARGPDANIYPWGNTAPACDLLNYNKCIGKTTSVIAYPQGQSYYQALDMEGNANEWVADRYGESYYTVSPPQNPPGPDTGKFRSVRASNFDSVTLLVPAATRSFELPENHRNDLGFRCVPLDPTYFAPFCRTAPVVGLTGAGTKGDCPTPKFKTEPACPDGKTPGMYVTYDPFPLPPGGGVYVPPECTPISGGKYFCTKPTGGDVGLVVTMSCTVKAAGGGAGATPLCLPGYMTEYDGTSDSKSDCVPSTTATAGSCLPGYSLDPAAQCCSPTSTTKSIGPCPAGFSYIEKEGVCSRGVGSWAPFTPGECTKRDRPGDPGLPPPPPPCNAGDPNCPG